MNYKTVDFSTWPRGNLFRFYMDHMRVVMKAAGHEVLSGHDLGGVPGDQCP